MARIALSSADALFCVRMLKARTLAEVEAIMVERTCSRHTTRQAALMLGISHRKLCYLRRDYEMREADSKLYNEA